MNADEINAAHHALADDAVVDLMADVGMKRALPDAPSAAIETVERLGWLKDGSPTVVGYKVSDSCREFRFWQERGRTLPYDGIPELGLEYFRGKDVVELGSGFGCNLLSLSGIAKSAVGVEIEPVYCDLAPALARRATLPEPILLRTSAEETGLDDASCDAVLVLGALQYMRIRPVLTEIHRVLRPGGTVHIVMGHLAGYLQHLGKRLISDGPRAVRREVMTVPGMLAYPWVGRMFLKSYDNVYPTRRRMRLWLSAAGLTPINDRVVNDETVYLARKA